jgi:Domain of unknown function (DUF4198)
MQIQNRIALLVILIFGSIVAAHDLFLIAKPFILEKPGTLTLNMNLAEAFPGEEVQWKAEKTTQFQFIGPGIQKDLTANQGSNPTVTFDRIGTYLVTWGASASYIEIQPDVFNQYITLEGYKNVIQMRAEEGKLQALGREKYSRFLKCVIQVGSERTADYGKTLGQKIELVPQENPYSIPIGSELPVRLLFDGKPLQDARVMATYNGFSKEHEVYAHSIQTNVDGIVRVPIDHPGLWMIRANHMVPLKGDPKADWESYWSNISFYVAASQ